MRQYDIIQTRSCRHQSMEKGEDPASILWRLLREFYPEVFVPRKIDGRKNRHGHNIHFVDVRVREVHICSIFSLQYPSNS